jgi:DNA modification methylase
VKSIAEEQAWYIRLAKHMRDHLVERVPIRDRIDLLRSVYAGVYGTKESEANLHKFDAAVKRLNERVLGVILYQDDALQRIPALENGSVALVVADPPYNVTDAEWDHIGTDDDYIMFTRQWLQSIRPKLAPDYHLFFFCDPDYAARIETELLGDWPIQSRIIWWNRSLPSGRQPEARFARTWQMIFHVGTHRLNWPQEWSDERFDVQVYAAPNANTRGGGYHPTPKPQALIEHLVRLGSKPTDLVVDPFAGGGTTGAACAEVRQRRCVLIEKEDSFCQAIEHRLEIWRES